MRDHLLIYVNGQRHEIRGPRAFLSLSDYLRHDLRLTGTKIVCAEGDCGSCSVLIGTVGADDRFHYRTVTSCIQFLHQLDCAHVVTIEGLTPAGALNAVQRAMVDGHGAQCGFCTPGFVVSLCAAFDAGGPLHEPQIRSACVGNLCRCTGYEPIIGAAMEVERHDLRPLEQLFASQAILEDLRRHAADDVLVRADERVCFKPASIASAARFRGENPDCTVFAGGTDLGVQINKGLRDPQVVLSLAALDEMSRIRREGDVLVVGAAATISELERVCADALPEYARLLYWFGSPPIRNAGTLGGNIANGSPIGDTMPALYVLDAEIELTGPTWQRRVNINDFYTGYRSTVMGAGELISRIFIPLPPPEQILRLYKISRRKDLDIAAFTAAIRMRLSGNEIVEACLAFGGVGPTIVRLPAAEEYLREREFTYESLAEAGRIARAQIRPISDVRGSAEYRGQLAENILLKFFYDVTGWGDDGGNGRHEPDGNGAARFAGSPPHSRPVS